MAGDSITTASSLQCPHGGSVQITSTNTRSNAVQAPLALATDTFMVTGCPFTLPGPVPSPCVTVMWMVPDVRVRVNGVPTLSRSDVGMCIGVFGLPQGPVIVASTQARGKTQ